MHFRPSKGAHTHTHGTNSTQNGGNRQRWSSINALRGLVSGSFRLFPIPVAATPGWWRWWVVRAFVSFLHHRPSPLSLFRVMGVQCRSSCCVACSCHFSYFIQSFSLFFALAGRQWGEPLFLTHLVWMVVSACVCFFLYLVGFLFVVWWVCLLAALWWKLLLARMCVHFEFYVNISK